MSRKSRRNPAQPVSPQPPAQATPDASQARRRNVFVVAAMVLLLVFVVATMLYKAEPAQPSRDAAAQVPPALLNDQAPRFGSADARVQIVEFLDPACETCASFFVPVKRLLADHPDRIGLAVRHLPLHKGSDQVVRILEAARAQDKYPQTLAALIAAQPRWVVHHQVQADQVWPLLDGLGLDLDRLRADMNSAEVTRRIERDSADARTLGVTQTPEFFVNGRPLPSFGLQQLHDLVQEELQRAYR